jgi:hypothetical protein
VPARRVPEKISRETEQTHVCRLDIPTIVDRIDPSNLGDDNLPTFGNHQLCVAKIIAAKSAIPEQLG